MAGDLNTIAEADSRHQHWAVVVPSGDRWASARLQSTLDATTKWLGAPTILVRAHDGGESCSDTAHISRVPDVLLRCLTAVTIVGDILE